MHLFFWPLFGLLAGFVVGSGIFHADASILPVVLAIVLVYTVRMLPARAHKA